MKCIGAGPVEKEKEKSGLGATEVEVSRDTTDLGLNIDCSAVSVFFKNCRCIKK